MNIVFSFKNFEPSDHLKKYARRRFEKLGRFLHKDGNVEVSVALSVDKFRHKAEVQFSGDNLNISAVEQSEDMYATVDMIFDKVETQLKKHSEKLKEKRRGGRGQSSMQVYNYDEGGESRERVIVDVDNFNPKPLHVDEAAMQLEQRGGEFLVFLEAESEKVNVLYKQKDGNYGLIAPGV